MREHLDELHPGQHPNIVLRTLQRCVKQWQATNGPVREAMFLQSVPVVHQGLSDFTVPNTPATIAGEPFTHLLYIVPPGLQRLALSEHHSRR